MDKILTAEEFRIKEGINKDQDLFNSDLEYLMIEFAKYHVQKAIDACIEEASSGASIDPVSYEDVVYCLKVLEYGEQNSYYRL